MRCYVLHEAVGRLQPARSVHRLPGALRPLLRVLLEGAYASWGALGIIMATGISVFAFKEPLNAPMIAGIVMCVAGVLVVNIFSTH